MKLVIISLLLQGAILAQRSGPRFDDDPPERQQAESQRYESGNGISDRYRSLPDDRTPIDRNSNDRRQKDRDTNDISPNDRSPNDRSPSDRIPSDKSTYSDGRDVEPEGKNALPYHKSAADDLQRKDTGARPRPSAPRAAFRLTPIDSDRDAWIEPHQKSESRWGNDDTRPIRGSLRRYKRKVAPPGIGHRDNLSNALLAKAGDSFAAGINSPIATVNPTLYAGVVPVVTGVATNKSNFTSGVLDDTAGEETAMTEVGETTVTEQVEAEEKYSFPWTWLEFFNPRKFVQAWTDIPRQYFSLLFGKANNDEMSAKDKKKWATMLKYFLE